MTLAKILTASIFLIIAATVTVAQEWVVDRVVQPAHYTLDYLPEDEAPEEQAQFLLVAAQPPEPEWVKLVPGMTLPNASWVRTGDTGRLQLRRGEEMIEFKPGTTASVLSWEHDGALLTHVRQSVGSLFLEVETRDTKHTMVETPVLAALVKGTRFAVEYDEVQAVLRVDHGIVEALDKTRGERVDVRAQQTVQVSLSDPQSMTVQGPGPKDEVTKLAFPSTESGEENRDLPPDGVEEEAATSEAVTEIALSEEEEEAASGEVTEIALPEEEETASGEVTEIALHEEEAAASGEVTEIAPTSSELPETNRDVSRYAPDGVQEAPVASGRDAMVLWQTALLEESRTARLAALLTVRLEERLWWELTQAPLAVLQADHSGGDASDYWILDVGADHGTDHPDVTETTVPSVDLDHVAPASSVGVLREEEFPSKNDQADVADADVATSGGANPPPTSSSDTVPSIDLDHVAPASVSVIREEEFPSENDQADVADADVATSGGANPPPTSLSDPGLPAAILTGTEFMASLHAENAGPTGDRRIARLPKPPIGDPTNVSPMPAVDVVPVVPLPAPALLLIGALASLPAMRAVRARRKPMGTKSSLDS